MTAATHRRLARWISLCPGPRGRTQSSSAGVPFTLPNSFGVVPCPGRLGWLCTHRGGRHRHHQRPPGGCNLDAAGGGEDKRLAQRRHQLAVRRGGQSAAERLSRRAGGRPKAVARRVWRSLPSSNRESDGAARGLRADWQSVDSLRTLIGWVAGSS